MKKNKGLKITIIILAILIILSVIAFALIYVFTDLFKSNKELFAKYAVSMMQEKTAFLPSNLKEYINKKSTTPYENNGSLTANISSNSNEQINNMFNFANNARINFSGKVDAANNRDEQNINIFYTNDVSLPFNYKHVEDIYALQADFALPNYVGIENNNIPELLQKLGVNIDSSVEIPNKIEGQELESIKFSDEEMKGLYNNYLMPAINNLTDDKFSKMENSDGSVDYAITLTVEDLKNILIQMLQNLSQDTSLISKINSIYQEISNGTETIITADDVNDMISNLQETKVNDGDLTVTITQFNGKVNKVDITIISSSESNSNSIDSSTEETEANLTIIKEETSSNLTYDISLNMLSGETEITGGLEMSYTNINTSSVVENYAITVNVNDMTNLKYSFSNNVVFANSVGIADFDLNNTIVLNNYQTAVFLIIGTGIGAISYRNNNLQRDGYGHMIIEKNGRQCKCGKKGCFETYGSITALKKSLQEYLKVENMTGKEVHDYLEAHQNEEAIKILIDNYIQNFCTGLSSIIDIVLPEAVGFGGSFSYLFLERIQNKFKTEKLLADDKSIPKFEFGDLKNDAGIIGATLF